LKIRGFQAVHINPAGHVRFPILDETVVDQSQALGLAAENESEVVIGFAGRIVVEERLLEVEQITDFDLESCLLSHLPAESGFRILAGFNCAAGEEIPPGTAGIHQ
jgi:hypothetical protein